MTKAQETITNSINILPEQYFLETLAGKNVYSTTNLLVYWDKLPDGDFLASADLNVRNYINYMRSLGLAAFSEAFIAQVLVFVADKNGEKIPFEGEFPQASEMGKDYRQVREQRKIFMDALAGRVRFEAHAGQVMVYEKTGFDWIDITEQVRRDVYARQERVQFYLGHAYVLKYITKLFRQMISSSSGLLVFLVNSNPDFQCPTIVIRQDQSPSKSVERMADCVVEEGENIYDKSVKTLIDFFNLRLMRDSLVTSVDKKIIDVVPTIRKEDWLRYGLMEYIKCYVKQRVAKYLASNSVLCDTLDLEYQTLFRLTAFSIKDIFNQGEELERLCEGIILERGWRGLAVLPPGTYENLSFNDSLVSHIIEEQVRVIEYRLSTSPLPMSHILGREGIFSEDGWVIQKDNEDIFIAKKVDGKMLDRKTVTFREVDKKLAIQFHQDLHYIHTPRCGQAFGFFLEGEDLPFSVLSIEKVDRAYKRNTLLLFGFDPRYCVEFTRLYSWPGVPKNTTSAIFGETFSYLKQHSPRTEAAISAFMPAYATGLSMLTGGFDHPILFKNQFHYFAPVHVNGHNYMEHVTKRRYEGKDSVIASRFPLLPTIELISPLREPRFDAKLKIGVDAVEI